MKILVRQMSQIPINYLVLNHLSLALRQINHRHKQLVYAFPTLFLLHVPNRIPLQDFAPDAAPDRDDDLPATLQQDYSVVLMQFAAMLPEMPVVLVIVADDYGFDPAVEQFVVALFVLLKVLDECR